MTPLIISDNGEESCLRILGREWYHSRKPCGALDVNVNFACSTEEHVSWRCKDESFASYDQSIRSSSVTYRSVERLA